MPFQEGNKEYEKATKKPGATRRKQTTITLNKGDDVLIDWTAEYLGCTRSAAIRSAVRAFAMYLQAIDSGGGKSG